MTKPCLICGQAAELLYPEKRIVRCGGCGFTFADAEVNPVDHYNESYFQGDVYPDYERDRPSLQKNFERRLRYLRQLLPRGRRIFEIGSAYGYFIELAQQEYAASGIEISAAAAKFARERVGVDVSAGDFLKQPDPPKGDVGLICMWDVIEHLERPDLFIEKAARWLRRDGLIAVTTGDIASWLARWQGPRWRMICPPTHLQYFDASTLGRLFEKFGFEIVHTSHPGLYRSYRTTVEELLRSRVLRRVLTIGGRLDFLFYLNTFDIIFMVAQKKP
jgi:SAM-dependent methyltransferase